MNFKKQSINSKRKYSKISLQKRKRLVKLVLQDQKCVTNAAKKLCLKLCTARMILTKYKNGHDFPMKKFKVHTFPNIKATQTFETHEIMENVALSNQNNININNQRENITAEYIEIDKQFLWNYCLQWNQYLWWNYWAQFINYELYLTPVI